MTDKSWLLNPSAINAAKQCIVAVEQELGVKLKLSHPQFIEMIQDYADLTESDAIQQAFNELLTYADSETQKATKAKVVPLKQKVSEVKTTETVASDTTSDPEIVQFKGKEYPKFDNEGRQFRGLYRGQARYA